MRRWINLVEGRLAPLYHGTSVGSALRMLKEDVVYAGTSLTRSYRVAQNFADKTSEKLHDANILDDATPLEKLEYQADLGTSAIIAFDQAKLMHDVGLVPYNWYWSTGIGHGDPYERGEEFEEVTKRNAHRITRYIIGIESVVNFERFAALVIEQLPDYEEAVIKMRSLLHRQDVRPHQFVRKPIAESFGFKQDNPATRGYSDGQEWLERKRRQAEEAAKGRYTGLAAYLFSGAVTAWMGQTETMFFPSSLLDAIPGAMDEYRRPGDPGFDYLIKKIEAEGFDMSRRNAVLVGVNHEGRAYVFEGNTRAAVAKHLGIRYIPAEFRWFNGAELVPGDWTPDRVAALAKDKP